MANEITAQDRMEKEIGSLILRGFDVEFQDVDSDGRPRSLSFYRLTEGTYEETVEMDVVNETADYYGFDKLDHRVTYDYKYDFNLGKKVEGEEWY